MTIPKFEETISDMLDIHKKKNADYAKEDDPFFNFRECANLGICTVEQGILVRMTDKMTRIANLISSTTPEVKDEKITDTLIDLANYAVILKCYLEDEKKKVNEFCEKLGAYKSQ